MINKGKSFWCERWHQQVYERLCMHRYMKGLKKCEGCTRGKELIAAEISKLKVQGSEVQGSEVQGSTENGER